MRFWRRRRLRALRETWPAAEIDVLCSANGASALEGLPGLHELIVVNKEGPRPAGWIDEPSRHVLRHIPGRPAAFPALRRGADLPSPIHQVGFAQV